MNFRQTLIGFAALLLLFRVFIFLNHTTELLPQEALLGYRAHQLTTFGTDELHRPWPVLFSSVHGYGDPITSYSVVASVKAFGLHPWSIRLPFFLISLLGIAALWYLLRRFLHQSPHISWWSVFIIGLSPVHTALSNSPSTWFFFFNLLLILTVAFLYFSKRGKITITLSLVSLLAIWIINLQIDKPQLIRIFKDQINFTSDVSILNSINQMRGEGSFFQPTGLWSRLFYNKTYILSKLTENFFNHLKPQFYFAQAGRSSTYAATNFGVFMTALIIPFLIGIKVLVKLKKSTKLLLAAIFIIGITPSVFSFPSPHPGKMLFAFIPITIITALGISRLSSKWKVVVIFLTLIHYTMFSYDFLVKDSARTHILRCSGIQQLAEYLGPIQDQYTDIYISDAYCPQAGIQLAYYLSAQDYIVQVPDTSPTTPQYRINLSQLNQFQITNQSNWDIIFTQPNLLIIDVNTPTDFFSRYHGPSMPENTKPCFLQNHAITNIYDKEIYQIYQTVNQECVEQK